MPRYNFIDLFAGAGGFSEGLLQSRVVDSTFRCLLASDINKNCHDTHRNRWDRTPFLLKDITEDDFLGGMESALFPASHWSGPPRIDVVVGGPSCQSFSLAGKRTQGDPRDDLFEHYLKVVRWASPRYFVMENVPGILSKDGGQIAERILARMRESGYHVDNPIIVDAANHGVPQRRRRVLFIGSLPGEKKITEIRQALPSPDSLSTVGEALAGIPNDAPNHETIRHSDKVVARNALIQRYGGYTTECREALDRLGLGSKKRNYHLLDPNKPSPTVMTIPDDLIHPHEPRHLTVREMARLQSFPDDFEFIGKRSTGGSKRKDEVPQYTMVGNAIPPLLARAIGNTLLEALSH